MTMMTVHCFDCEKPLDAEAETAFWDDAGDIAWCQECVQERVNEACRKGVEVLQLCARLATASQDAETQEGAKAANISALAQQIAAYDPQILALAADALDSTVVAMPLPTLEASR